MRTISENEIHLWVVRDEEISDLQLLELYHGFLSKKESEQQKRFYFEKHRHQYLVTRALVRSVLSMYSSQLQPHQWQFDKNAYGKPSIANPGYDHLKFNLSHTENMVVLAIANSIELGVDVEWILRDNDILSIPDRFFSPQEVSQLQATDEADKRSRFFDFWTLKEAYIKACGKGLSIPLDKFSYIFTQSGDLSIEFAEDYDDSPRGWRFWQIIPNDTHKIALAVKNPEFTDDYILSINNITPQQSYTAARFSFSAHHCSNG